MGRARNQPAAVTVQVADQFNDIMGVRRGSGRPNNEAEAERLRRGLTLPPYDGTPLQLVHAHWNKDWLGIYKHGQLQEQAYVAQLHLHELLTIAGFPHGYIEADEDWFQKTVSLGKPLPEELDKIPVDRETNSNEDWVIVRSPGEDRFGLYRHGQLYWDGDVEDQSIPDLLHAVGVNTTEHTSKPTNDRNNTGMHPQFADLALL